MKFITDAQIAHLRAGLHEMNLDRLEMKTIYKNIRIQAGEGCLSTTRSSIRKNNIITLRQRGFKVYARRNTKGIITHYNIYW